MKLLSFTTKNIQENFPNHSVIRGHITTNEMKVILEKDGELCEVCSHYEGDNIIFKVGALS